MAKWSKIRWAKKKAHPVVVGAEPVQVVVRPKRDHKKTHPHHRTGKTAARARRERALQRLIQKHSLTPRSERVALEIVTLRKRI